MARARILKPGFFTNERLAELPFEGRLLFAGLWTLADREGRLEDRGRRIKAAVFPFDAVDVDGLLAALERQGFIERYTENAMPLIQIAKFADHQTPHHREPASTLPPRQGTAQPQSGPSVYGNGSSSVHGNGSTCSSTLEPPLLRFSVLGRGEKAWELSQGQVQAFAADFPTIDVLAECRKAHAWIEANPGRRKTASGMPRFLVNWLSKATNWQQSGLRQAEVSPERQAYDAWREAGGCHHTPRCGNYTTCQIVSARKRPA